MKKYIKQLSGIAAIVFFSLVMFYKPAFADAISYENNATLIPGGKHPGVYEVTVTPNADGMAKLGIPSIAKGNLETTPTPESPAIIMGAAAPFERKINDSTGFRFERTDGGSGEVGIYPPYSYFRYQIMSEKAADGSVHKKLSGFDGSYVIIRVDVSNIINAVPEADREGSYLHVKQEGNAALMVALGPGGSEAAPTFSDALGNKTGSYSLAGGAAALKDTSGDLTSTPYIDVILMSSGTLVAGADVKQTDPTKPTPDFKLKFYVDKTKDYLPGWTYDPAAYTPTDPNAPTLDAIMMAKYYYHDESDKKIVDYLKKNYPDKSTYPEALSTAQVSSYKVMGSDLELEIIHGDDAGTGSYLNPAFQYWSLRKALNYDSYNNTPIKLICEVPVLEGLLVDGTGYTPEGGRKVILDVNSFDIQIANHEKTDAAALTVKNAEFTIKDGSNTTGAELAVGNNARMTIQEGGTFIIDKTCQLEIEYDAASVVEGETPPDLNSGIISIENRGKLLNNGVLTIEGTEGKPEDPTVHTKRDKKDAVLLIQDGGTLENNGCVLSYGELYNMGTIENKGKYNELIISTDPDKGTFTYHKGIQISWKDDVTQDSTYMGHLYVGQDNAGNKNPDAVLNNYGDVVLVPGILECYGKLNNVSGGNVYVCPVEEAIIPINPLNYDPLKREKRIKFGEPMKSYLDINEGGTMENAGVIRAAEVEIVNNGRTGKLTPMESTHRLFSNLAINVLGTASNSGTVLLDGAYVFGELTNTDSIGTRVVLSSNDTQKGIFYDKAATKLNEVYNASLTVDGSTNIWKYGLCSELVVSPTTQERKGGEKPVWTIRPIAAEAGNDFTVHVRVFITTSSNPVIEYDLPANKDTEVTGPVLPEINSNIVYDFRVVDGVSSIYDTATVVVTSEHEQPPAAIGNLVYNGQEQALVTTGGGTAGALEYRLGTDGEWSDSVPTAKDAGNYTVYYRLKGKTEADGSTEISIAKRPVVVSAADLSSKVGEPLRAPEYTVSGVVEGDVPGDIVVSTAADITHAGTYAITVSVSDDNPNYAVETKSGTYTVTSGDLEVTAKDKYGVFSDELTYAGFNIELLATPSEAAVYYNFDKVPLTAENYEQKGTEASLVKDLPAKAGTHPVYYYVKNGADAVSGCKSVIIEKAQQKAPDKVLTHEATSLNSCDGYLEGLEPRSMEYRRIDNDGTYTTAYYEREYVLPGIYLVRMKADENHYASPDCVLTVNDGQSITVSFYRNDEDETPIHTVEGLKAGDLVAKPEDPVWEGSKFLGWYNGETPFNFNRPVTMSIGLIAHWDGTPPHTHELTLVEESEATCTENGNKAYYTCSKCSLWFEDATALVEIKDRASVIIEALGHDWDSGVVTKEPTYYEEGTRTITCRRDFNHTKTEVIPKKKKPNPYRPKEHNTHSTSLWTRDASGWHYKENGIPVKNAWRYLAYNGKTYWYYFDDSSTMKTGWFDWNNSRYYLKPNADGWIGRMLTGWQLIDGKWYYFEPVDGKNQGHLYRSEATPDGYRVGADGAWDGKPAAAGR